MFDIAFCSDHPRDSGHTEEPHISHGVIRLNEFNEIFECSLEYWDKNEYRSQWYKGICRAVDKRSDSCLITSITNPATANFLVWWPMYVVDSRVVFRNQLYFLEGPNNGFDVEHPYRFLMPRKPYSEDGEKVSEWSVSMDDLKAWIDAFPIY